MADDYEAMDESEYPPINGVQDSWGSRTVWGAGYGGNSLLDDGLSSTVPIDAQASWFKRYWRPAIAWQYFAVCLFDFIIGPCALMVFFYYTGQEYQAWHPLTAAAGGFYHVAMGAIIGVTAYGRSQEKLRGIEQ